jgi:Carboxypeptidase regulatory-like domain
MERIILLLKVATMCRCTRWVAWFSLSFLICGFAAPAQSQQFPTAEGAEKAWSDPRSRGASTAEQSPDQQALGSISGKIVDQTGAAVGAARVKLSRDDESPNLEVLSDEDGGFAFANVAPGSFQITITAEGFSLQASSGVLQPGERQFLPQIALALATAVTEVRVVPPRVEVAEDQIKEQEKQRVLGVVPNFYVSYVHNAMPLAPKQKFELAWKTSVDPISFGVVGVAAGVQQAQNDFNGYGQGAQGYAKRFAASYGDFLSSTFIGGAILPSLLKQDPRYFYKGTGSKRSRILYAIANSVICKGDDGHWQANYSSIGGSLAAGGISNLYYPASSREGLELTFENALIGIGESATVNLLQEFVVRRISKNVPNHEPATP